MEINDIIKLIEVVSEHGLTSFVLEENGSRLSMKKEKETVVTTNTVIPAAVSYQANDGVALNAVMNTAQASAAGTGADTAKAAQPEKAVASIGSENVVKSPLVGTFFDSPSPDAPAFVTVGDRVKKGQVLGIIEAMKLLNEIESEFDGIVEAVLVKNGEVVEYGQPMFRIK